MYQVHRLYANHCNLFQALKHEVMYENLEFQK